MSLVNSDIHEGVPLEEAYISIPVSVYEELIRAETERDILEATLEGENKYQAAEVLGAIKTARNRLHRGTVGIQIDICPAAEPVPGNATDVSGDKEKPNDAEACK